jgi:hypothetical protein
LRWASFRAGLFRFWQIGKKFGKKIFVVPVMDWTEEGWLS